jgi:hypothetical protein
VLPIIGLSLILIGWIEQVYRSLIRRRLSFSPFFLTLYLVGAAILAYDSFNRADITTGVMYALTTVLAFIILMALIVRRGKPGAF